MAWHQAFQGVNRAATQVMAAAGVDLSSHRSKSVEEFPDQELDLLVTGYRVRGAKESCPMFFGKVGERRHWSFDDPAEARGSDEEVLAVFLRVRDEIRARVEAFLMEAWPSPASLLVLLAITLLGGLHEFLPAHRVGLLFLGKPLGRGGGRPATPPAAAPRGGRGRRGHLADP